MPAFLSPDGLTGHIFPGLDWSHDLTPPAHAAQSYSQRREVNSTGQELSPGNLPSRVPRSSRLQAGKQNPL